MREKLRNDDKKRVTKELPELIWNPDTQKEEVRETKKEDKKDRSRSKDEREKRSPDKHVSRDQ